MDSEKKECFSILRNNPKKSRITAMDLEYEKIEKMDGNISGFARGDPGSSSYTQKSASILLIYTI